VEFGEHDAPQTTHFDERFNWSLAIDLRAPSRISLETMLGEAAEFAFRFMLSA